MAHLIKTEILRSSNRFIIQTIDQAKVCQKSFLAPSVLNTILSLHDFEEFPGSYKISLQGPQVKLLLARSVWSFEINGESPKLTESSLSRDIPKMYSSLDSLIDAFVSK